MNILAALCDKLNRTTALSRYDGCASIVVHLAVEPILYLVITQEDDLLKIVAHINAQESNRSTQHTHYVNIFCPNFFEQIISIIGDTKCFRRLYAIKEFNAARN